MKNKSTLIKGSIIGAALVGYKAIVLVSTCKSLKKDKEKQQNKSIEKKEK